MEKTTARRKQATPERWKRALERAVAEGLHLYKVSGTGEVVVTSGRQHETVYATDGIACDCEAAMLGADPVCKHRAIFWKDRGLLNEDASVFPDLTNIHVLNWGAASPRDRYGQWQAA